MSLEFPGIPCPSNSQIPVPGIPYNDLHYAISVSMIHPSLQAEIDGYHAAPASSTDFFNSLRQILIPYSLFAENRFRPINHSVKLRPALRMG